MYHLQRPSRPVAQTPMPSAVLQCPSFEATQAPQRTMSYPIANISLSPKRPNDSEEEPNIRQRLGPEVSQPSRSKMPQSSPQCTCVALGCYCLCCPDSGGSASQERESVLAPKVCYHAEGRPVSRRTYVQLPAAESDVLVATLGYKHCSSKGLRRFTEPNAGRAPLEGEESRRERPASLTTAGVNAAPAHQSA